MADDEANGSAYEDEHVHTVYEQIAPHFSSTRYKPWPIVSKFLQDQPPGAIGLDVGCGNGKYLAVNADVFIVASDRSTNLAAIAARHDPHATIVADTLALPHPPAAFDFALAIAVVHHLSTPRRRVDAVRAVLETLRPPASASAPALGGKALFFVWALEQKGSRRGWEAGGAQDVMVPWVMAGGQRASRGEEGDEGAAEAAGRTFQRYYHLYRAGELEDDVRAAGGEVLDSGYERDNWWAIAVRRDGGATGITEGRA